MFRRVRTSLRRLRERDARRMVGVILAGKMSGIVSVHGLMKALRSAGILGLSVSEVPGYGRQGGKTETFRGGEYKIDFVPKVKIEVLVETTQVDKAIDLIAASTRTGKTGDGKISACDPDRLMRVRTGELGDEAV